MISDYLNRGGAAIAASRLCEGWRAHGHQVGRFYCFPPHPVPGVADAVYPLAGRAFFTVRMSRLPQCEIFRKIAQKNWRGVFRNALKDFRPDVISLHNLHGAAWDLDVVDECLRHAPVVWTMHDMWPITGSCAYSFDCRKYETACDSDCPQLGVYPTLPASMIGPAHARRRAFYATRPRLALVAPSRWLADCAAVMTKGVVPALQISNGIDLTLFRPMPKKEARAQLNLTETDKPTLLAAAASLTNPTKGMGTLIEALGNLADQPLRLLLMGSGGDDIRISSNVEIIRLGSLGNVDQLRAAYNAADLFVHPSHADNQPLVIMEGFACGIPVIGMPVDGVPEMALQEKTGWMAKAVTAGALADAINAALAARSQWAAYSQCCRNFAEVEYGVARQALRYETAFQMAISNGPLTQAALDAAGNDGGTFSAPPTSSLSASSSLESRRAIS